MAYILLNQTTNSPWNVPDILCVYSVVVCFFLLVLATLLFIYLFLIAACLISC
jgi:hypothetical protein